MGIHEQSDADSSVQSGNTADAKKKKDNGDDDVVVGLIDDLIADWEKRLELQPGEPLPDELQEAVDAAAANSSSSKQKKEDDKQQQQPATVEHPLDILDEEIMKIEARLNLKPNENGPEGERYLADIEAKRRAFVLLEEERKRKRKLEKENQERLKWQEAERERQRAEAAQLAELRKEEEAHAAAADKKTKKKNSQMSYALPPPTHQPEICKLALRVGVIVKVWVHPEADKLYCEEIDIGEDAPRQIASGLRPHFTEDEMQGRRVIVIANLKARNLVGFKSHGMVLCAAAAAAEGEKEIVEFVEPPADAEIGELITFDGVDQYPQPFTASQVDKRKVWQACLPDLRSNGDRQATWKDHVFMTSAGPCTTKTIADGALR